MTILFVLCSLTGNILADDFVAVPWIAPSTLPLKAIPEKGFNFMMSGGGYFSHGRGRTNFFSTEPWESGWISSTPLIELGFSYAPNSKWQFGLQVPALALSSTLNAHYAFHENFAVGLKVGVFSSLYLTSSIEMEDGWFFSLSPALGINQFGVPGDSTSSATPPEKIDDSRFTAGAQLAIGHHHDPFDLAFFLGYDRVLDGEGVENSFIFDDVVLRHFVRAGLSMVF